MEWKDPPADLKDHVVICNCNKKVGSIIDELQAEPTDPPIDTVLMVQDKALWERHPRWRPRADGPGRLFLVAGCTTNKHDLERARISQARAAIILADPAQGELVDARSTLVAIAIEQQSPGVHTIMELLSSVTVRQLGAAKVNEVVCLGEIAEQLIAQDCITPGVKNIFEDLLRVARGTNQLYILPLPAAMEGATYAELARRTIRGGAPHILCGFIQAPAPPAKEREADHLYVINPRAGQDPGRDTRLKQGDRLVLLARQRPDLSKCC